MKVYLAQANNLVRFMDKELRIYNEALYFCYGDLP